MQAAAVQGISHHANEAGARRRVVVLVAIEREAADEVLALRAELVAASRALDRVLLHKYIVVPHWYSSTHRVAYRNRFGIPTVAPKYYQADPYVISSWWQVKPRKAD